MDHSTRTRILTRAPVHDAVAVAGAGVAGVAVAVDVLGHVGRPIHLNVVAGVAGLCRFFELPSLSALCRHSFQLFCKSPWSQELPAGWKITFRSLAQRIRTGRSRTLQ